MRNLIKIKTIKDDASSIRMQEDIVDNADNWDDAMRKLVNVNAADTQNDFNDNDELEIKKDMQDTQSFKVYSLSKFPHFCTVLHVCLFLFLEGN